MCSDQRIRPGAPHPGFDFADVDPRATSKAWNRFLSDQHSPSLPFLGVRSVIYQSWVRSSTVGVRPDRFAAPSVDRGTLVTKSTHDNAELRRATRASLAHIGDLLAGAEAMLILTDRSGVILESVGDTSTLSKAAKINLGVGGVWSESASGTNGIGTSLATGHPVYVHGEEHFCEGMKAWSCAGAPIRDPIDGTIIGIVNLSGLTTIFQKHNAAFAATAARDIEIALRQEQWQQNMRLMEAIIGTYPARAQDPTDGLAIIDRFGRLIFNRNTGLGVGASNRDLGLGARFLELHDGISEDNILASLPPEHRCHDIRLIVIDGEVRGAALVFSAPQPVSARPLGTALPALPGLAIGDTALTIVGRSEAILQTIDLANRIAAVNTPILIEGETGVGKELFARLIHHRMCPDQSRRFAAVNCGALTPQMLHDDVLGPMQTTEFGSLCLDEIGELPADIQPHLLRVIEDRMTGLYGPGQPDPSVRVLSLTNRVLLDEVAAGRFRRDLFYRISSIILKIPPLRDRGDDTLLIAQHYNLKISVETGRDQLVFGSAVQEALLAHDWPGNVRELRNTVAALHFLAKSRAVALSDLPPAIGSRTGADTAAQPRIAPQADPAIPQSLHEAQQALIQNALAHHRGNMSQAAKSLGISRPTLYRKMLAFGIKLAARKPSLH